jgi:hypothetical protein
MPNINKYSNQIRSNLNISSTSIQLLTNKIKLKHHRSRDQPLRPMRPIQFAELPPLSLPPATHHNAPIPRKLHSPPLPRQILITNTSRPILRLTLTTIILPVPNH